MGLGSDWKEEQVESRRKNWSAESDVIRKSALRLFNALQQADYENPGDWQDFPAPDVQYQVYTDAPAWMHWICTHFRTNPIVSVDLGKLRQHSDGWPCFSYALALEDGSKLEGVLSFKWDARTEQWYGVEGLNWHLQKGARK